MLHYGRHLLEPVGASLQRLEAQVRALDEKVERGEAVQRAIEGHTAERVDMARARLDAELRGLAEAHRAAASRELGSLSATLGGLVRDADRILGRLEDLASASNPRRAATLAGATIDVAAFASSPATMVSYAQNREDVLLQRLFPRDHLGFYVDVGAGDPVEFSVTKHFYDRGWHGINLEPAAHYFDRLVAQRPRDVNLKIGAWDSDGELDLLEATTPTGLSTFLEDVARSGGMAGIEFRRRRVPVSTLVSVLGAYAPDVIDFLKVDVEGAESRVLAGNDWGRFRPRVVVVESTRPGSTAQTHEEWETELLRSGYVFAAFDGLNRFYVRSEDAALAELLRTPANVFDGFLPYEVVASVVDHLGRLEALGLEIAGLRSALERLERQHTVLLESRSPLSRD
jgi:FkbM family methyltransferase